MVQVIDDERDVFAHIDADIVRSGEKLRCLVYQVGGQDAVDQTVLIVLVKLLQSVGKQTEGRAYEYMLSPEEIISSMIRTSLPSTLDPKNSWATIGLRPLTILV